MSKSLPKKKVQKNKPEKPPLIPEKYQDWTYIIILTVSVFIFFAGAIAGGGFAEFDNISSLSFVPYLQQASHNGKFPLWMPYIFSGMPGYAALLVTGERIWDFVPFLFFGITGFFKTIFANDTARIAIYYSIYAAGIYLFLRFKKQERVVAFLSAFAAVFSTWVITWVMIGHNTKPLVFAMFPFVFLFMEKLREKFSLLYAVLLIFTVHLMFEGGHLQMIFYGGIAFGLYLIYEFITRLIKKTEAMKVLRVAALLIVAAGFAFLMSADRYFSVQEYTPYSTRGSAPILKTEKQHQDNKGGNDYQYATMWSYSPLETWTFFVPGYFGHGVQEWAPEGAPESSKQLISTYWGSKETEDSPPYMGILVLALAIFGFIFYRKDTFVQFLLVLIIFAWFLAMGKNLPVIYDLFYYNFPNFNKFRAPSMAFALIHFAVPLLAGYGLTGFFKLAKESKPNLKPAKLFMIYSGGFFVLGLIFIALFKTSYISAVSYSRTFSQLAKQVNPTIMTDLQNFVWSVMVSDWLIGGLIITLGAVLIYLFIKGNLSKSLLVIALLVLFAFDLWRVDYRRMDISKKSIQEEVFKQKSDVFDYLKQDKDIFRIADFSSNPANIPAYFLMENINGYHAAKLRIYQDLLDVAQPENFAGNTSQLYNPFLWNILNVKYVITNQPLGNTPVYQSPVSGDYVYLHQTGLPRAFFVKSVKKAKQLDILHHLRDGDFNPIETAFVENDLAQSVEPFDSTVTVKLIDKQNEYLKFDVNASDNNFLFISEIYYPISWKAYIDGKEVPIIKSDFAFRGLIVPKGKHIVEMKFVSEAFERGKTISIILNILTALTFFVGLFFEWRKKKIIKKEN